VTGGVRRAVRYGTAPLLLYLAASPLFPAEDLRDPDMPRRFVEAFPETCQGCLDADGRVVPRPGGAL
jgi:hypothetical protein